MSLRRKSVEGGTGTGTGTPGAPGTSFRTGHGAPADLLGINGDTYLNLDTDDLYGPKAGGAWGASVGNIHGLVGTGGAAGAAGVAGIPGAAGAEGHSLLSGHGAPAAGLGTDGDSYLDEDTGDLYGPKAAGAWGVIQGNLHGAVGNPGTTGATGATGSNPRGVWNSGNTYAARDVVSFFTGSYMALNAIAAGGASPAVDTVNWMQLANGGGEIAGPVELTANFAFAMTAATLQDVTGMSLPIPAGAPAYEVLAEAMMVQFVFGAAATATTQATLRLLLVDEGNVALAESIIRINAGAASAVQWGQSRVSRKMPATAAAKTVKLSGWLDSITNITSVTLWAGAGTGTPPGTATLGPVSMVARAR